VTSLFSAALGFPHSELTSTPIATPENAPENFTLKAWSEEDAIALIKALDEYADANDLCFPAGCNRNNFYAYQKPIKLALQETLWRFPNTTNSEQYQWRLALANVIRASRDSDEWLLAKLEELLNQTRSPVESLNAYVEPHGFFIIDAPYGWSDDRSNIFTNLFGDQTDISVYRLTTQGSYSDGLFFAVRADVQGKQKLIPIYSEWNFFTADYYIADFSDHNLNGIPEITLYLGRQSGSMCSGEVLIFEWQEERFAQLIDEEPGISFGIMDCENGWGYSEPNENGIVRLYAHSYSSYTDYYKWDGNLYRLDERDYGGESVYSLAFGLEVITNDVQPVEAIRLLNETLPSLQKQEAGYGSSTWDYFRFQLGLFYAIQSRPDEAKVQFQSVANTPTNPSITVIPQAAQAFLDHYEDNASIYHACNAALDVMQKALDPFRDAEGQATEQQIIQTWGYTDAPPLYPLCNLDLVLPYITRQFNTDQMANMPATLSDAGVTVEHSAQLDLDGDGDQDWIEVVTKPSSTDHSDTTVWALLQEPPGLLALRVNKYSEDIDRASAQNTFAVEMAIPSTGNQHPIVVVRSGNRLFTFQVLHSENTGPYLERMVSYWPEIANFSLAPDPRGPKLTVTYPPDEYGPATEIYLWDGFANELKLEEDTLGDFAERAAQSIWQEGKAAEAIPALQSIVNYRPPICNENYPEGCDQLLTERSRYHYLLALAYELTGDETAAVQTYWQLWHDFPHSPYALMARAKLEPLNP
jgi:hypothetical protein